LIPSTSIHLKLPLHQFLPPLLEKLNDPKERIHSLASSNIVTLGKKVHEAEPNGSGLMTGSVNGNGNGKGKEKESMVGFWDRSVREVLAGKGWRGKVEGMKVLLRMRDEDKSGSFGLKPWIAPLVDLLEDSDGNVRDQAREVSHDLFRSQLISMR
jgi:CLIP-associating protein 1/2